MWGVDEAALEALGRQPKTTNHLGLAQTTIQSPRSTRRPRERVVARLTVSAEGRATE